MTSPFLYALAFAGGLLAILSPCILPVLPFVFARADRSFRRETLPMLLGLALTFALIATAGTASAAWIAHAADAGRWIALLLLTIVGISLLSERAAAVLARPFVRLGTRLTTAASGAAQMARNGGINSPAGAVVVGMATGLLWAPCAGPILGLIFATAAVGGDAPHAATLFFAFAVGAATSLAVVLFAGGRLLAALRRTLGADLWIRRGMGGLALAGVLVIALGWDATVFSHGGIVQTAYAEDVLIRHLPATHSTQRPLANVSVSGPELPPVPTPDQGAMPTIDGATGWINSAPLTRESLLGKVVLVDFWTFECYNCLNALPHVKALDAKYRGKGLVVLGVHTPELPRERLFSNVQSATKDLGITYPVATDNNYAIWRAFNNEYWPAAYIIDRAGRIRYHHFGEGQYDEQDRVVKQLLDEPTPLAGKK
ncbi:MAG: cytochrome c biogenesis protein/redoxin [Gemmatimonadaceae bacterium]